MKNQIPATVFVIVMVAAIVAVDVLFFKDRFWQRLAANVGIALLLTAFFFRFLKRS